MFGKYDTVNSCIRLIKNLDHNDNHSSDECTKRNILLFLRRMRRTKIFALVIVVSTVLMTTFSFYTYQIIRSPNILVEKNDRIFIIHENQSYDMVRDTLYRYGYINDIISFSFLSKLSLYSICVVPFPSGASGASARKIDL